MKLKNRTVFILWMVMILYITGYYLNKYFQLGWDVPDVLLGVGMFWLLVIIILRETSLTHPKSPGKK